MKSRTLPGIILLTSLSGNIAAQSLPATAPESEDPVTQWLSDRSLRLNPPQTTLTWKFAHPAPPTSLLPPIWQAGFDWLTTVTSGAIEMKVYGSGSLYGTVGGVKALRAGVADYGTCYTVGEANGFELLKTFQAPYVAPANPYLTFRIINELMPTYLRQEFNARGVYPAHVAVVRPLTLMSREAIRVPADLKGKKVVSFMTMPSMATRLGYAEVRMPFTEIYTALQQGLIDAVIWIDMGFVPFRIYEQAKFYTVLNIAPTTLETCFNPQSFDALPAALKPIVYDFQQQVGVSVVHETEKFANRARDLLSDQGVTIIEPDEAARALWKEAMLPVREDWLQQCEAAGKPCRKLVTDIDRLVKQYEGLSNAELMERSIKQPVPGIIDF